MTQFPTSPEETILKNKDAHFIHPFTNMRAHEEKGPMIMSKGEGVHVFDLHGKSYIDGFAGLWCNNLGHNHPRLVEAAMNQFKKLSFFHNFTHKSTLPVIELSEKLVQMFPAEYKFNHLFYANSGSEANDTAIKLIWYYNNARGFLKKKKIIARQKAYHGSTIAAGSLTGLPHLHNDFDLPLPQIHHVSCPHFYRYGLEGETEDEYSTRLADELENYILEQGPETVAAFFAEPLIGSGGVYFPPKGYFEKVHEVLKRHDILMVVDEVVCAFGRTGNMFGSQTFNIKPDMMTLAKGITSAHLPLSAVAISDHIYEKIANLSSHHGSFAHGFTYSGHPVCAAVANAALDIYQEMDVVSVVKQKEPLFLRRLNQLLDHPLVGHVRGVGLLGGFELVKNKETKMPFDEKDYMGKKLFELCQENGVIIRAMGDIIGICPPYLISQEQINEIFDVIQKSLDQLK